MTPTEALNEARKFSAGISDWIDEQRSRGRPEIEILQALKAATDLARFERESKDASA